MGPSAGKERHRQEGTSNQEVALRNESGRKSYEVLSSYGPCNNDELKLAPEKAIEDSCEVEEGWWKGQAEEKQVWSYPIQLCVIL